MLETNLTKQIFSLEMQNFRDVIYRKYVKIWNV